MRTLRKNWRPDKLNAKLTAKTFTLFAPMLISVSLPVVTSVATSVVTRVATPVVTPVLAVKLVFQNSAANADAEVEKLLATALVFVDFAIALATNLLTSTFIPIRITAFLTPNTGFAFGGVIVMCMKTSIRPIG